jgi:6-phosphogluconate dehydrogenase
MTNMSVGVIGLGSIGSNLALNIQKKHDVHVYNRSPEKTHTLVNKSVGIHGYESVCEMISKMEGPRTIITSLPYGLATDNVVSFLSKTMTPGDTIVDCSNEYFETSRRRESMCNGRNIKYLGVGISGGIRGALNGPCLMVGGDKKVYQEHQKFFESFAVNVTHMSTDPGSGHFTKMVHNGIEYGMLQAMSDVFAYCNQDQKIMKSVLRSVRGTDIDGYLTNYGDDVIDSYHIHTISDVADMNNTGKWCSKLAIDYAIPTPTIDASVNARTASRFRKAIDTKQASNVFLDESLAVDALRFAFAASMLEGYDLINTQNIKRKKVTKAWSRGTLIECDLVEKNLYEIMDETAMSTRIFVMHCVHTGIPCPAIQAALTNYDFTHQRRTSINYLMAQRHYFGNHSLTQLHEQ